jgi:hypothetical protein
MADFIVEISVRKPLGDVYGGERLTHAGMGIVYGAMLANLYPTIREWGVRPTALEWTPANTTPMFRWCLTGMALGVLLSGMCDLYASLGLPCGDWPWTLPDPHAMVVHDCASAFPPCRLRSGWPL